MGGTGGGLVYNVEELRTIANRGISASMVGQILVEESVLGWEELELEVVRDAKNQMITVCFIENVDAMGVHTGDSYCTAPMLTISEELQKKLQDYSYRIVEAIRVIGGTNIGGEQHDRFFGDARRVLYSDNSGVRCNSDTMVRMAPDSTATCGKPAPRAATALATRL